MDELVGRNAAHHRDWYRAEPGRGRRYLKPALALAFVVGALACTDAWAGGRYGGPHGGYHGGRGFHGGGAYGGHRHSHGHVGLYFSAPLYWGGYGPGWYDDPWGYRYARPVVVRAMPPPVYVERTAPPPLWYFCGQPQGYYPYVQQCSVAWRSVPAHPPAR